MEFGEVVGTLLYAFAAIFCGVFVEPLLAAILGPALSPVIESRWAGPARVLLVSLVVLGVLGCLVFGVVLLADADLDGILITAFAALSIALLGRMLWMERRTLR